jgi:hypothetical protein
MTQDKHTKEVKDKVKKARWAIKMYKGRAKKKHHAARIQAQKDKKA